MSAETYIAAAVFLDPPALGFDAVVDLFDDMLRAHDAGRRSLVFDYDDIALIEIAHLRIGLAWVAPDLPGLPYSLVIATGAAADAPEGAIDPLDCETLREAILDRLCTLMPVDTVLRSTLCERLDSELLDKIAGSLQALNSFDLDPLGQHAANAAPADLADLADLADPATASAAPVSETTAGPAPSAGFTRLRAAYRDALRQDQARRSVVWQAMMASANNLIETVNQGAELIRQVANSPGDPYGKLATQPRPDDPMARHFDRFDQAEYELYGKLLD